MPSIFSNLIQYLGFIFIDMLNKYKLMAVQFRLSFYPPGLGSKVYTEIYLSPH